MFAACPSGGFGDRGDSLGSMPGVAALEDEG